MSLSIDGVWKSGVWATTVWADGVWREGAAPVAAVAELPGGTSKRDKKRKKGPRPRYYWEDPTPEPVMEFVEAPVQAPEPIPIQHEPVVDEKAARRKARRRLLLAALVSRMLH